MYCYEIHAHREQGCHKVAGFVTASA
jgi:hypothetical protein